MQSQIDTLRDLLELTVGDQRAHEQARRAVAGAADARMTEAMEELERAYRLCDLLPEGPLVRADADKVFDALGALQERLLSMVYPASG